MTPGQILGPGGNLARVLAGFEDRPEQRLMADAVAAAIDDERPLLVEAGTGTGKTLAYLVPAALSGKRVVVSTGTRALQEQLIAQDLPLAEAALGRPIKAAVLKGVSNYLCRRKASAIELQLSLDAELEAIRDWMLVTESGDRAEMGALGTDSPWWELVTTSPEARLGPKCPHHEQCFVTRARRAADKAEIVIVNHHLFFADLALRGSSPGGRVLPDYDAVVFDEAHLLEDVMTEHFGFGVSTVRLALFCKDLGGAGLETAAIERTGGSFFNAVRGALGALLLDGKVALPDGLFADPDLKDAWFDLDGALEGAEIAAKAAGARAEEEKREEWEAMARRAGAVRAALSNLAEPDRESTKRAVRWGEVRGGGLFLRAAPIDVSDILRERVLPAVPAAVFTSATLTSARRFTYVRERLGLTPEACDELHLDSPFDYARQAMLYVPRDLPPPGEPGFTAAACARAADLCRLSGGRAFVLFTSHRALREASAILPSLIPFPLLVQGQAPPPVLLERFRAAPSVLLATGTFWAGVDVPGDALSLVVMDKLPFASPGDPLVAARAEALEAAGRDPFGELSVPQAALAFRQGFGRLIRRRDDRGIAAVLDGRIVQKRYGQSFLSSLPPDLPRTSAIEVLRRWWDGVEPLAVAAPA
ncbi:MAG TPA: ATP-dependent DNA helicase [Kofleriaceae bacterium]